MDKIFKIDIDVKEDVFGPFYEYLIDPNVINIDYSAGALWVDDLKKGIYKVESVDVSSIFLEQFTNRMRNLTNQNFNAEYPKLEAEAPNLRITITHEDVTGCGRSVTIRKSKAELRHTVASMLFTKYMSPEILSLLINACTAKLCGIYGGQVGVGKTELLKFFMQFIPKDQKTIIVEDTTETYYDQINPGAYYNRYRITDKFSYEDALRGVLRSNAERLYLIEARGREIQYVMEGWSTALAGATTIHLEDLRLLDSRITTMAGQDADKVWLKNMIYESVDFALTISTRRLSEDDEKYIPEDYRIKNYRYVEQLYFFDSMDGQKVYPIVDYGKIVSTELPQHVLYKMQKNGITKPFQNDIVDREVQKLENN